MLNNVLLLHYNNYFNRIVKKESDVAQYRLADTVSSVARYKDLTSVNFVPGDGITTKLVIGKGEMSDLELSSYDYVVVYDKDANNNETILHRWFILEYNRTRGGQYEISLRRDVIVDYNDAIKNAPIFVDKAIIQDEYSPFLYNNENVSVNQIKTEEYLLQDGSYCPWLVMYLKKKALGNTEISTDAQGNKVSYIVIDVDESLDYQESVIGSINTWTYYKWSKLGNTQNGSGKIIQNNKTVYQTFFEHDLGLGQYAKKVYEYKMYPGSMSNRIYNNSSSLKTGSIKNNDMLTASNAIKNTLLADTKALDTTNYLTEEDYDTIYNTYNNKIIKDGDGKYYKATVKIINSNVQTETKDLTGADALFTDMTNVWQSVYGSTGASNTPNNNSFKVKVAYKEMQILLEEQTPLEETVDFAGITNQTVDSPLFDAISIPYGDFMIKVNNVNYYYTAEKSLKLMNEIARQLSSAWVLDLQVLPYCPFQGQLITNSYVNFTTDSNVGLFGVKNNVRLDFFPIVPRATFSFDVYRGIGFYETDDVPNTYKIKYFNDCTMVRLCSPNYAGVFEFNLAKDSQGAIPGISYWNVDMTLRPYNPYIHINPEFGNLYGQDWDDSRGLVCGGDFSLGIINDAWVQYEIQNKNYQAIFDRQIENLDVNNKINKEEAGISALLGVGQGAMRGGIVGGVAGGGIGAAVGAGAGAVFSALGGLADMNILAKRQKEQRDFAIDNYNLQLGNVKALPNSITKTSALTANNKLFPFIEIYKCTEQEKQAYYNKIKYDGMTVGIIDKLENYLVEGEKNFFKGQLIRCEEIEEDNHMLEEINNELAKGVYI
jgi:hypothetical protein